MKNRSTKHKIAIVEIVIVVLLAVWLFFPKNFQKAMGYDFDPEQVTAVTALLAAGEEERTVDLSPADPAFEELMTLLESSRYRAQGVGGQDQGQGQDYRVTLTFRQNAQTYTLSFAGGEQMDFHGSGEEGSRAFRTSDNQAFQQEILDVLLAQPYTVID